MATAHACPHCPNQFQADVVPGGLLLCPACGREVVSAAVAVVEPGWFYVRDRKKSGPVTFGELQRLAANGGINPADMVLRQGTTKWVEAGAVEGLLPASPPDPGPPPLAAAAPDAAEQVTQAVTVDAYAPANAETVDAPKGPGENPLAAQVRSDQYPAVAGHVILGVLGRGGMGVVYKARQVKLNRLVALKMILSGEHAGPDDLARFLVEARAVARLKHPNVVQIHEIGEWRGGEMSTPLPYFSLEFVEGGSLDRKLRGVPQPPREAAEMVKLLSLGIHAAHQEGIVHRDLKPGNVLLGTDGVPKITDFGLAKQLNDSGQTRSGAIMGTPSYMAPEQAAGRSHEVGPASDVYALGAILYEMLTGRPPFKGETPTDTIMQVVTDEPVPPSRLRSKLPRDLEIIALKCLEKKPQKRYASAQALADDLGRFLASEPILARPVGRWERAVKWAIRRPAAAGLLAVSTVASLLLVTGLLVGIVWISIKQRQTSAALHQETEAKEKLEQANKQIKDEQRATKRALDEKAAALDDKAAALDQEQRTAYFQRVTLAEKAWSSGKVGEAEELLGRCPVKLRDWEWHYLKRLCHESLLTLRDQHSMNGVTFSPDGRQLAAIGMTAVQIYDLTTGRERFRLEIKLPAEYSDVAYTPDGKRLVAIDLGTVTIWDAATGKVVRTIAVKPEATSAAVAVHPDGQRLATNGAGNDVKIWNLETGQEMATLRGHVGDVRSVAFSPNGRHLASASSHVISGSQVKLWDLQTGRELFSVPGPMHSRFKHPVVFSPDGLRLASVQSRLSQPAVVTVWDVATGQATLTLRGHGSTIEFVAFSPDGRRIVTGSSDQTIKVWDAATGEEVASFRGSRGHVTGVAIHPGGQFLASSSTDGTLKLWDATTGQEARALRGQRAYTLAFNPRGPQLAVGGRNRDGHPETRLWDAALGQVIRAFPDAGAHLYVPVFSPDGRRVALIDRDKYVTIWDTTTRQKTGAAFEMPGDVETLAFSPDGWRLVCAATGPTKVTEVKVLDLETRRQVTLFRGALLLPLGAHAAFHPDGRRVLVALGATVRVWDADAGRELEPFRGGRESVGCLAFAPDGRWLATGSGSYNQPGEIRIWDAATRQIIHVIRSSHLGWVKSLAWCPGGRRLVSDSEVIGRSGAAEVKLWAGDTGEEILTLHGYASAYGGCLSFSSDGRQLAAVGVDPAPKLRSIGPRFVEHHSDNVVKIWDATPGQELHTFHCEKAPVDHVAYSPDGQRVLAVTHTALDPTDPSVVLAWDVAAGNRLFSTRTPFTGIMNRVAVSRDGTLVADGSWDRPGEVRVWNPAAGKEVRTLTGQPTRCLCVAFNGAGDLLAVAGDDGKDNEKSIGQVSVLEWRTGKRLLDLKGEALGLHVAFSPDGKRLATTGGFDKLVKIWNVATGQELQVLRGHSGIVTHAAFSADGRRLATAGRDRLAKVWDLTTGRELLSLEGHLDDLHCVTFRPDGQRLATGSGDHAVKIWNTSTGQEVLTLRGHTGAVVSLAYSPDGQRLASGSLDNTVKVWQPDEGLPDTEARWRQTAARAVSDWRKQEAEDCEWNSQWFAAAFHLTWLLRDDPTDASLYLRRGHAYAKLGQADKAAADRAKAEEIRKSSPNGK